jgi:hypothetical protein
MNRRELIKKISILTGATVVGSDFFLSGCKQADKNLIGVYSDKDISFFDEVAETIIPKSNTPGAKDAEVGKFMASYSTDCYDDIQLKILKDGIRKINDAAKKKYDNNFLTLTAAQKQDLLTAIDTEAKKIQEENEKIKTPQPSHYFTLMKQMVLLGFFTSEPGATQVLRYVPVPGKYEGCINYKEGETSWA